MAYYTIPEFEGKICGQRLIWETAGELVYLEPYGKDAIRFRSSKSLRIDERLDWTLLPAQETADVQIHMDTEKGEIVNGKITASITGDGTVTYRRTGTNEILLEEY